MKATQLAIATAVVTCLTAWSGYALATQPGNNGNGNGGCGNGQQTNGCGSTGGSATGGSANVLGSGNSSVKNDVNNVNANNVTNRSENNNSNVSSNRNSNEQAQRQNQTQSNRSSNSNSVGATGSGNATNVSTGAVTVGGDNVVYQAQERNPVSTAYAAPLAASNGTCMGSSSIGGQGASLGLSFGTTWTDSGCDARYDATALVQAGQPKAAIARLCLKAEIAQAMKDAGTPCPGSAGQTKKADGEGFSAPQVAQNYQDPIIRARLGLPPLK